MKSCPLSWSDPQSCKHCSFNSLNTPFLWGNGGWIHRDEYGRQMLLTDSFDCEIHSLTESVAHRGEKKQPVTMQVGMVGHEFQDVIVACECPSFVRKRFGFPRSSQGICWKHIFSKIWAHVIEKPPSEATPKVFPWILRIVRNTQEERGIALWRLQKPVPPPYLHQGCCRWAMSNPGCVEDLCTEILSCWMSCVFFLWSIKWDISWILNDSTQQGLFLALLKRLGTHAFDKS